MATYTSDSLDSVKITAGDGTAYKTRYLTFSWSVISTSTGETTIKWEVYGKGGNTAYSTFSIKLNGETVYSANNEVISYKSSTPLKSDTKTYKHNSSGAAAVSVEITVTKIWNTISSNTKTSNSWDLETNYPYTECQWSKGSSVWIEESIQKPGANITIKWSGAQPGTANPIAGFEAYYSLDGGSWNKISTSIAKTSSSITMKVPNNRGSTITAKVVIKNTESFTNPSKSGGSCLINRLPSAPTNLKPSQTIIPSTANSISFSMNAGSDKDGQSSYTIKYATSEDSTKRDYDIGTNLPFNTTEDGLTYYFWTWDGLEPSENSVSYTIIKNTKPTVSIGVTGTYVYDITATKGDNGQSNDKYSYGYTYGEDRLIITTTSTEYNIGDIRYLLSKQLNGLEQGKTYSFRYWVQRNDGVESSNRVYSNQMSFTTPNLNLNAGNGPEGYFGTNIDINVDKSKNNYYPTGIVSFDKIQRGKQLNSIEFKNNENSSQFFNIKLTSPLTRVYGFDFANLQIPTTFKPYSSPILSINMTGRESEYGFNENSVPKLTIDDQSKGAIFSEGSSNDTWNFTFTPEHLWGDNGVISNIATDGVIGKTIKLTISNDFGERFSKDISLKFDFREIPKIIDFQVCGGANIIKEGTNVSIQGEIQYFSKSVNFSIYEPQSNQIFYDNLQDIQKDYKKDPWIKTATGGWESNPYVCMLKNYTDPEEQIPTQEKTYTTKFQIVAQSGIVSGQAESQTITVQRHAPARIRFTELEYSNNTLSGKFKIEDFGYDSNINGRVDGVYLDSIEIYSGNITTNNEIPFEIISYSFGDVNFKSLAPICKTVFNLDGAETTKETTNLEYLIVYNILPTIAYRQNYLGVNTKNPSQNGEKKLENPAITISAYNQQNTVYLVSGLNIASINLETGEQTGFIYNIDCGSW